MKSLLTLATGILVFTASGASACPFMDGKQTTTDYDDQDQNQSLVKNDVEIIDPVLLAKYLLQNQEKEVN